MRSKDYWEKDILRRPFDLARRVLDTLSHVFHNPAATPSTDTVKYIWLHIDKDGISQGAVPGESKPLDLDAWLNVIDESSALGAEWLLIHAKSPLTELPDVWPICRWAQELHDMRVALHLESPDLSPADIENIEGLDARKTILVIDRKELETLQSRAPGEIRVVEANIGPDDRPLLCTNPEKLTCVAPDGALFCCGLHLGDERYAFGELDARPLKDIMQDDTLPHTVPDTSRYPLHACDGCPPLMAKHLAEMTSN